MNGYIEQPKERRRLFCEEAQERLNLPAASLGKDYWVCRYSVLRKCFRC